MDPTQSSPVGGLDNTALGHTQGGFSNPGLSNNMLQPTGVRSSPVCPNGISLIDF